MIHVFKNSIACSKPDKWKIFWRRLLPMEMPLGITGDNPIINGQTTVRPKGVSTGVRRLQVLFLQRLNKHLSYLGP